jgi:hypothetical protein
MRLLRSIVKRSAFVIVVAHAVVAPDRGLADGVVDLVSAVLLGPPRLNVVLVEILVQTEGPGRLVAEVGCAWLLQDKFAVSRDVAVAVLRLEVAGYYVSMKSIESVRENSTAYPEIWASTKVTARSKDTTEMKAFIFGDCFGRDSRVVEAQIIDNESFSLPYVIGCPPLMLNLITVTILGRPPFISKVLNWYYQVRHLQEVRFSCK